MIKNASTVFKADGYNKDTVIGEFSGRDSVAAIIKCFQREDINYILPIATFAGTEYGDYEVIYDNYLKLSLFIKKEYGETKTLYPLIEYNREDLWALMNGRYISDLVKKYGFYSPCIGCHLYFHLTKIPFANQLSKRIISGERESHNGKVKINQLHSSLECYKKVLKALDFELIMPLQEMTHNKAVEALISWPWEEGKDHPKCVLSGNYRDVEGKVVYDEKALTYFFDAYLIKIGDLMGKYLLDEFDLDALTKKIKEMI